MLNNFRPVTVNSQNSDYAIRKRHHLSIKHEQQERLEVISLTKPQQNRKGLRLTPAALPDGFGFEEHGHEIAMKKCSGNLFYYSFKCNKNSKVGSRQSSPTVPSNQTQICTLFSFTVLLRRTGKPV